MCTNRDTVSFQTRIVFDTTVGHVLHVPTDTYIVPHYPRFPHISAVCGYMWVGAVHPTTLLYILLHTATCAYIHLRESTDTYITIPVG